jgi:geranylgeranyl diphosphate synthase type I
MNAAHPDVAAAVTVELVDRLDALAGAVPGGVRSFVAELRRLATAGGKRLRPTLLYWGYRAGGGGDTSAAVTAGVAVELVHMCALIHDDILDASPLRRGAPSAHVAFADSHREAGGSGSAAEFGRSAAILLGDLALVTADAVFADAPFPPPRWQAGFAEFTRLRTEVVFGQYLDVATSTRPLGATTAEQALEVAKLKTAMYTVARPLLLGAALAGEDAELTRRLTRYGEAVGIAFQLRDDVLGAFGDPAQTGKPVGADFAEGKHTFLVARAWERATDADRAVLTAGIGRPDLDDAGIAAIRDVLARTGAFAEAEERIASLLAEGISALDSGPLAADVRSSLVDLATRMAHRAF